jgi:RHS repeat-associated protein
MVPLSLSLGLNCPTHSQLFHTIYDTEGRVSTRTQTFTNRSSYPMAMEYTYDTLSRLTDVRYPAQYGHTNSPRKLVHHDYDIASRMSGLQVDSASHASNITYNAASQITSMNVGVSGSNQITETATYEATTGLLTNQKVQRNSTSILDLTYDYLRSGTTSGKTGQLTKITNNLNRARDRAYSYDALGRLTQATGGLSGTTNTWAQNYSYDRYGNRTNVTASGSTASIVKPQDPTAPLPTDQLAMRTEVKIPEFLREDAPQSTSDAGPVVKLREENSRISANLNPAYSSYRNTFTPSLQTSASKSLSVNGSTGYVEVANSNSINITGVVTVEAWVKPSSVSGYQSVIARVGSATTGDDGGYAMYLNYGTPTFYTFKNANQYDYISSNRTLSTGQWYHIAGVYDGSTMKVYVDGELQGSKTPTITPTTGTGKLMIGAVPSGSGGTYFYNGLVDEARVSAAAVYTANFAPPARLDALVSTRGLWKFDLDTAADSTSNGNTGTLTGGYSYSTDVPVTNNHSLLLNGTSSYVDVAHSSTLNITGALTLEAWVKTNSVSGYQTVISRIGTTSSGDDGGYSINLNYSQPAFYVWKNNSQYDVINSSKVVSTGVWHHIAGVYDGTNIKIYVDGELAGSKVPSYTPASGTGNLKIGALYNGPGAVTYNFNGLVDEARLTAAAVYTSNFTPATQLPFITSCKGLWRFDGEVVTDSSGNSNNGTLVSSAAHSIVVPSRDYRSLQQYGTNGYVDVPHSATINITGAITVEAWIKPTATDGFQAVMARYGASGTDGGYSLYMVDGVMRLYICNNGGDCGVAYGSKTITPGEWTHIAGVADGTNMKIYVNGLIDVTQASTRLPASGSTTLTLGADITSGTLNYPFNGSIDEVRVSAGTVYTTNFSPEYRHGAQVGSPATKGLWKFDYQSTYDSSGMGNNGSRIGTATYSSTVPEKDNRSIKLDGVAGYANVSGSALSITGALTVEAWFKASTTTGNQCIVSKVGTASSGDDGGYAIQLLGAQPAFYTFKNGSQYSIAYSGTNISADTWYHVAGVYDGTNIKIYLNGVLTGTATPTYTPAASTSDLKIGALNGGSGASNFFKGYIDQVRVSTGAVYTSGFTPETDLAPLNSGSIVTKGLWKFHGGSLSDSSGNGYTATLVGGSGAQFSYDIPNGETNTLPSGQPVPRDGYGALSYSSTTNRITSTGFTYDAAGNQTKALLGNGISQKYKYDQAGRLVKVKDDLGNTITTYTYGIGRERLITQDGSESSNLRTYYMWGGASVATEYTENDGASTAPSWQKNYVYMGGRLLSTIETGGYNSSGQPVEKIYYHHADRLGTRLVTNSANTSYFEQATLPYGTALDAESSGATNRRFTSYDRSVITGLDYAVNRFYDPTQGRFTTVDPLEMGASTLTDPQTLNQFTYSGNDPVNRIDPDGLRFSPSPPRRAAGGGGGWGGVSLGRISIPIGGGEGGYYFVIIIIVPPPTRPQPPRSDNGFQDKKEEPKREVLVGPGALKLFDEELECESLRKKIQKTYEILSKREYELQMDPLDLDPKHVSAKNPHPKHGSVEGHQKAFKQRQDHMKKLIKKYEDKNCPNKTGDLPGYHKKMAEAPIPHRIRPMPRSFKEEFDDWVRDLFRYPAPGKEPKPPIWVPVPGRVPVF